MPSLPIVPTQVALRGNVGSLDAPRESQLFTFGPRGQGIRLNNQCKLRKRSKLLCELDLVELVLNFSYTTIIFGVIMLTDTKPHRHC